MPVRLPELSVRDKPVSIQAATEGTDASGAPVQTWATTLADLVWMSKEDVRGRERMGGGTSDRQAAQLVSGVDTRWTMPYQSDMDPDVIDVPKSRRLVYRGRVHDIVFARAMQAGDGIELMTVARTVAP